MAAEAAVVGYVAGAVVATASPTVGVAVSDGSFGNWGFWSYFAGDGTITYRDPESGFIMAAADPRREMYALGY